MSDVETIADLIFSLTQSELRQLREILEEELGEGGAGVLAGLPPDPPPKESGAETDLPEDYWETAQ